MEKHSLLVLLVTVLTVFFDPVSESIILLNGVVNEDVYAAAGGDGFSGPHSAGGDGFSDAANAL